MRRAPARNASGVYSRRVLDQLWLREHAFPLVAEGYDPAQVDQVLDAAASEIERLRRPAVTEEFSDAALEAATALRRLVSTEIEQVKQAAKRGVEDLQAERERLLVEAQNEGRRIVDEARRQAERMVEEADEARRLVERERNEVQARLDSAVRTQTDLLAALEAVRLNVHHAPSNPQPGGE